MKTRIVVREYKDGHSLYECQEKSKIGFDMGIFDKFCICCFFSFLICLFLPGFINSLLGLYFIIILILIGIYTIIANIAVWSTMDWLGPDGKDKPSIFEDLETAQIHIEKAQKDYASRKKAADFLIVKKKYIIKNP